RNWVLSLAGKYWDTQVGPESLHIRPGLSANIALPASNCARVAIFDNASSCCGESPLRNACDASSPAISNTTIKHHMRSKSQGSQRARIGEEKPSAEQRARLRRFKLKLERKRL